MHAEGKSSGKRRGPAVFGITTRQRAKVKSFALCPFPFDLRSYLGAAREVKNPFAEFAVSLFATLRAIPRGANRLMAGFPLEGVRAGEAKRRPGQISKQSQNAQVAVLAENRHGIVMESEDCFNLPSGAIPSANPNHLGGKTEQGGQIAEISVPASDCIPLVASGVLNRQVRGSVKSHRVDMCRARIKIRQAFHQPRRKVLIKEELQSRATMRWCSRSAA